MTALALVWVAAAALSGSNDQGDLQVRLDGSALLTGRMARFVVQSTSSPIRSLTGALDGRRTIAVQASADGKTWLALAAVNVEAKVQPVRFALAAVLDDGSELAYDESIAIVQAPYDQRELSVSQKFVKPSRKQKRRAAREAAALEKVLAVASAARLWRGSFAQPTAGAETSPFGTLRTYNGKKKSRHLGLDLDGRTGDAIVAANGGRVLLASERFYSGGTVVVDHGEGLLTLYFHMSRIDVKPGDVVVKGQGLGLLGATGQVTGPHLHFAVRFAGLYQDPRYVLTLDLASDTADVAATQPAGPG